MRNIIILSIALLALVSVSLLLSSAALAEVDDEPPRLVADITPSEAAVGQDLTFEAEVTDNVGVDGVWVEYWYDEGDRINTSMAETVTDRWAHTIAVGLGAGELHYVFHYNDSSGNWNSSEMTTLTLEDLTPPTFGEDATSPEGTTGDPITFLVNVTDDVAVQNVSVVYWSFGFFFYDDEPMEADGDAYSLDITIPDDVTGTVNYWFHAYDTSGNNATSEIFGIIIDDNDPPTGTVDQPLPGVMETGQSYQVTVSVDDNWAVWSVTIVMSLDTGEGEPKNRTQNLQNLGATFSGTVIVSTDEVGTITHHIVVEDMYQNIFVTTEEVSDLVDSIPPKIEVLVPITTTVGHDLSIEVEATDNIAIVGIQWKGLPFKPDGFFANGSFDEPGEHKVTVTVVDAAGNEDVEEFIVFVEDDVSATTVMIQIAVIIVLAVVGLMIVKWIMNKRSQEQEGDPELEDAPDEMT
jgi:hypothetical protein